MVRYKVVTNERYSITISKGKKYRKHYLKGKTVEATKGTLGIFVFDNLDDADDFRYIMDGMIIKVKPIGNGKRVKRICGVGDKKATQELNAFYRGFTQLWGWGLFDLAPKGTICYPAVKVLE